jgi:hypothetical protein
MGKGKGTRTNIAAIIIIFMYECIYTRFGCPLIKIIYQGIHLINDTIKQFDITIFIEAC